MFIKIYKTFYGILISYNVMIDKLNELNNIRENYTKH